MEEDITKAEVRAWLEDKVTRWFFDGLETTRDRVVEHVCAMLQQNEMHEAILSAGTLSMCDEIIDVVPGVMIEDARNEEGDDG